MMSTQLLCLLLSSSRRSLHVLAAAEAKIGCIGRNCATSLAGGVLQQQRTPSSWQYFTAGQAVQQPVSLKGHQGRLPVCQPNCHYSSEAGPGHSSTTDTSSAQGGAPLPERMRDMAIAFTCGKCDSRTVKAFSRQAYEQGVVLITCPSCKAMHLIADHLGWFGDKGFKIDEYMQAQGHAVKRISQDQPQALAEQLTVEDLAGWSKVQQLLTSVAAAASQTEGQGASKGGGCGGGDMDSQCTSSGPVPDGQPGSGSPATHPANSVQQEEDDGVLQLEPDDVAAWVRVQQDQQQKQDQAAQHCQQQ